MEDMKISFKCVITPTIVEKFFSGRAKVERGRNADLSWISGNVSEIVAAVSGSQLVRGTATAALKQACRAAVSPAPTEQQNSSGGSIVDMIGGLLKEFTGSSSSAAIPEGPAALSITFVEQAYDLDVVDNGASTIIPLLEGFAVTKGYDWKIRPVTDAELLTVLSSMRVNGEQIYSIESALSGGLAMLKLSSNPNADQIVSALHARLFPSPTAAPPANISLVNMFSMFGAARQEAPPAETVSVEDALDCLEE